jgi:hypothetical protein
VSAGCSPEIAVVLGVGIGYSLATSGSTPTADSNSASGDTKLT